AAGRGRVGTAPGRRGGRVADGAAGMETSDDGPLSGGTITVRCTSGGNGMPCSAPPTLTPGLRETVPADRALVTATVGSSSMLPMLTRLPALVPGRTTRAPSPALVTSPGDPSSPSIWSPGPSVSVPFA